MSDQAETLCERAKAGDREAAAALVTEHYQRLFWWFRRLCGHEEEAADLTQKTFCKVWIALDTFQGRSSFSTWLHGIGYHVYLDWRRRANPTAQPDEALWRDCPDDSPGPFENTAEREQANQLYALVEQLDEETRQTVHIHYYQGLSLAETAATLGIATSTVKYRLREAVEFLKGGRLNRKYARVNHSFHITMNESQIESLLRKAPPLRVPPDLRARLLADIDIALPRSASTAETRVHQPPIWRRWFPALAFGILLLACLVVLGLQTGQLMNLRQENQALRAATANLEQLRQDNEEVQRLRSASSNAAGGQRDREEMQKLQEEVNRLRPLNQEIVTLRAEQQRLANARPAVTRADGTVEEDPFAAQKARAEAVACINNLKQLGLAARMWANDHNTNQLPTDVRIMQNEMPTPKILTCPSDSSRARAVSWDQFDPSSLSYQFPSREPSELEPYTVYSRCPIHGHLGLSDGSVLNGNGNPQVVLENGQMKLLKTARTK